MILVVDDDILYQKLMTFYLKNNYEICFGATVHEAKESLIKHNPKVILLDLTLSCDETGLDLCIFVQETEVFKHIPIILVTGHVFSINHKLCEDAGCVAFLSKPVKQNELLQVIDKYI